MTIYEIIKDNYQKVKSDDKLMWATTKMVSDALEDCMEDACPEGYWRLIKDIYAEICGWHFNEKFAEWQVSQFRYKGADGRDYSGGHWSKQQTDMVHEKHKSKIPSSYNAWDVYVGLNALYADLCKSKYERHPDTYEQEIIDDAIAFWFNDVDMPDGKVFWYFNK